MALSSVVLVVAGCGSSGEEQVQQMTETLVRTAASTQGQAELADVGVEVSGPLSCQTTPKGDEIEVACTGTALDGRSVTVNGTATSLSGGTSVAGDFVGTADGDAGLLRRLPRVLTPRAHASRRPLGSAHSARGASDEWICRETSPRKGAGCCTGGPLTR